MGGGQVDSRQFDGRGGGSDSEEISYFVLDEEDGEQQAPADCAKVKLGIREYDVDSEVMYAGSFRASAADRVAFGARM